MDRDPALDTFASPELWTNFAEFYRRASDASKLAFEASRTGAPKSSRRWSGSSERLQFLSREVFEGAVTRANSVSSRRGGIAKRIPPFMVRRRNTLRYCALRASI